MSRFARIHLAALLIGAGLFTNACTASAVRAEDWKEADAAWRASLERVLARKPLRGAEVGVLVVDADDGAELFAREPDRALVPASNQKLLTGLAAADAFGPSHRFTTEVWAGAKPDAEGRVPWLAIRGSGDPAMTSEQWWRLAADLRRLGVTSVTGPVHLDASAFDDERWHPEWGTPSARAYHAPVAAISANYGAYAVVVEPTAPGEVVRVRVDPPVPYLRVLNQARTSPRGGTADLVVDRRLGKQVERVVLTGRVPAGTEAEVVWRSVLDPVAYAAAVLGLQLEANGIAVAGPIAAGPVPDGGVLLHEFEGRSLAEILRLLEKYSSNVIAESLLKALGARATGAPGSFASGRDALEQQLRDLGLPVDSAKLVDGSGLSRDNRVSPRLLVAALRAARDSFAYGPELLAALPIAGGDGTMSERAEGAAGRVRAKTGLLTGVTALSGLARRADGRVVAFSILANDYRGGGAAVRATLDAFAEALTR